VVTDGAGFSDFVRPGIDASSVPPDDVPALASALVTLLTDRQGRKRLGDAAAEASRAYDTPVAVDRYVRFFERVAAEGSHGGRP
jgi:glycosyltransferase involved in cell wall biosynthesis